MGIKLMTNIETMGIESSIRASKYAMSVDLESLNEDITKTVISLGHMDGGHDQFLTGMHVNFDLTFSNKAWVEIERYRFVEFVSSQSTMHRCLRMDLVEMCNSYVDENQIGLLKGKVELYQSITEQLGNGEFQFLNSNKLIQYINSKSKSEIQTMPLEKLNKEELVREYLRHLYLDILYNLPSGLKLTARLTANYRCLKNVYKQRKNHRLPEWQQFCKELEELPHFMELCID